MPFLIERIYDGCLCLGNLFSIFLDQIILIFLWYTVDISALQIPQHIIGDYKWPILKKSSWEILACNNIMTLPKTAHKGFIESTHMSDKEIYMYL